MPPRAKELRFRGRMALKGRWPLAVAVTLVAVLLGGYLGGGEFRINVDLDNLLPGWDVSSAVMEQLPFLPSLAYLVGLSTLAFLTTLAIFLIGGAVELGHCLFYTRLHRGEDVAFADLFARFDIFLKALGLRLYMGLFIFLWSLLLVIPGIIAYYRYSMAVWLMAENPALGIREAVDMSKYMMSGHKSRLFFMQLSFIGWAILCALSFGIGYLFLNPYMCSATAGFYLDLLRHRSPYQTPEHTPEREHLPPQPPYETI